MTNHQARTLREFVAWAKANPARDLRTGGAGSLPHLLGVLLGQAAGIELTHIPYKGVPQLDVELMGGEIAAGIGALSDLLPLHRAGKLRILATSDAKRSPLLPDVPTFAQQGYPSVEVRGCTPSMRRRERRSWRSPDCRRRSSLYSRRPRSGTKFAALGREPAGTTPEAPAAIMAADTARWRPIAKASGFTAD